MNVHQFQVDKRKKYEEEALSKKLESESAYRCSVDEANERHRNLLHVKKEVRFGMANIKETFHSSILDVPNWKQNTYFFFFLPSFHRYFNKCASLFNNVTKP